VDALLLKILLAFEAAFARSIEIMGPRGNEGYGQRGLLHDVAEDCGCEPRFVEIAFRFCQKIVHEPSNSHRDSIC
jgi:hypothetical protein